MIRAFSRWLFMRTHRAELLKCAAYARGSDVLTDTQFQVGSRDGMCIALETLGLLI